MILSMEDVDGINIVGKTLICNPEGKQLYLFDVSRMQDWIKHHNQDTYSWKCYSKSDRADPSVKETYCYIYGQNKKQNSDFTKRIMHFKEDDIVMIRYAGNKMHGAYLPHGNSKQNKCPYIPVSNVVLQSRVAELAGKKTQRSASRTHQWTGWSQHGTRNSPKEQRACEGSAEERLKRPNNFLKDDLTACHRVGQMLPSYIRLESTKHNNANNILCHPDILAEYRKALDLLPRDQLLIHQLDTTFEFNKRYLSVLSFRHPQLIDCPTQRTEPTIPLVSYIHQQKAKYVHDQAFWTAHQVILEAVPGWAERQIILVTDREF